MIAKPEREQIIALIKREVVPAIGCTEPIAVALCVAKATETLGCHPENIKVFLSANILKNAMGVGIPGTDMIGLPIAVALGALIGKSEYELEVLKDSNPEAVEAGKKMIESQCIDIALKENIEEKLYIEAVCTHGNDSATAIISGGHTNFVYISRNQDVLLDNRTPASAEAQAAHVELTLRKVFDFATTAPLEEIEFILEARRLNKNAAERSFQGKYGHELGRMLRNSQTERNIMGNNTFTHILSYTSAACDARMAGAMIPVMSNSGSGNQGIAATLPVVVYAEDNHNSEEELTRALILSHLTAIYIKQSLGRLSALCGCVVAATGSSCGITYLMGGGYQQVMYAVQNMIATLTGMICDGAKPSCALKLTSGVSTAVMSAIMAMEQKCVTAVEGIIEENVNQSIRNLTKIGSEGMNETDKLVLDIMTHKHCD
ncbi:serine dehydratase subunit alpha family protein [Phocaeicola coprocola]|uniref:L-cysteine desulfidase family protein n=1 Tax=Phocaeicola coprocola TaxID=310298 RepID=UPI001C389592|nr:L-serine ammonia-lyase, iron-sulfur-dependent, subunit alpha [Phocaeicola coprocola]HJH70826.1 L-serine ammonia-lyase, iron-sulfur-dependent, subunit alpha [Bacteroidaceae bacterium]MBV3868431.1 L-serine ammonia-lyase, iron-sulfur-dependent, subunit alpha [Phocaeicola coprocola]MBV4009584.1 L-serine ammonia-lyase, iron-sulfur-dependent, subunit alpha [Phocaeicola coprocola]MBV4034065.1 L-serine ammonia-lyase, iron-sulfur-dependent, subunit alpha [Phocaeicola coprocola]MBV4040655.1 L-serine 